MLITGIKPRLLLRPICKREHGMHGIHVHSHERLPFPSIQPLKYGEGEVEQEEPEPASQPYPPPNTEPIPVPGEVPPNHPLHEEPKGPQPEIDPREPPQEFPGEKRPSEIPSRPDAPQEIPSAPPGIDIPQPRTIPEWQPPRESGFGQSSAPPEISFPDENVKFDY